MELFICTSGPIKFGETGHIQRLCLSCFRLKVSNVSNLHQLFYIMLFPPSCSGTLILVMHSMHLFTLPVPDCDGLNPSLFCD